MRKKEFFFKVQGISKKGCKGEELIICSMRFPSPPPFFSSKVCYRRVIDRDIDGSKLNLLTTNRRAFLLKKRKKKKNN